MGSLQVSIPFSSGRRRRPDHVSAVASDVGHEVSIPFSSGRRRRQDRFHRVNFVEDQFQSPSHRGGGAALSITGWRSPCSLRRFNPLLIGEAAPPVVLLLAGSGLFSLGFQSPSHRGGGAALVFPVTALRLHRSSFQSPSHRGGGAAPIENKSLPYYHFECGKIRRIRA